MLDKIAQFDHHLSYSTKEGSLANLSIEKEHKDEELPAHGFFNNIFSTFNSIFVKPEEIKLNVEKVTFRASTNENFKTSVTVDTVKKRNL